VDGFFRADATCMDKFFDVLDGPMEMGIRAIGLYVGYYLGIFIVAPFVAVFDAWSVLPLWGWMASVVIVDALCTLIAAWPQDSVPDVFVNDHGAWPTMGPQTSIGAAIRVGRRPRAVHGFMRGPAVPLHRRVRFGHTRLR
jgi:hypothetical protein